MTDTDTTPVERARELQALLERVASYEAGLATCDITERWGGADERAKQAAEVADLNRGYDEARAALEAFVAEIRVDTPAERVAWTALLAALDPRVVPRFVRELLERPALARAIAVPALLQDLDSETDTMRREAWENLVKAFELRPHMANAEDKLDSSTELEMFGSFLWDDLRSVVKIGADGTRAVVGQLQAGASPESAGIVREPPTAADEELSTRLRAVLGDGGAALPVEEIAQLRGLSRRWTEATIFRNLPNFDPRLPDALVRLGARWAAPVLAEVAGLDSTPPDFREQLLQSVRALDDPPRPDTP